MTTPKTRAESVEAAVAYVVVPDPDQDCHADPVAAFDSRAAADAYIVRRVSETARCRIRNRFTGYVVEVPWHALALPAEATKRGARPAGEPGEAAVDAEVARLRGEADGQRIRAAMAESEVSRLRGLLEAKPDERAAAGLTPEDRAWMDACQAHDSEWMRPPFSVRVETAKAAIAARKGAK